MNIGFIGYGEVGQEMSKGLSQYAVENIYIFDPVQVDKAPEKLSDRTILTYFNTSKGLVKESLDILFVAVPGNIAKKVWSEILDFVNESTILVDLTTASAEEKKEIGLQYEKLNKYIIDGAILGPLKVHQHRVSILVSGKNTTKLMELGESLGMKIEFLNENVGDATNFKFVRSIYTKGLGTLLYEVFSTAEKLGIEEEIYESLTNTMDKDSFGEIVSRYIISNVPHSKRRVTEMENVMNFMKSNGIEPYMTSGTKQTLEEITDKNLKEKLSETDYDWRDVIAHYNQE